MTRIFLLSLLILLLQSCNVNIKPSDSIKMSEHDKDVKNAAKVVAFKSFVGGRTYGTGFHISYLGKTYILTNKHVCNAGLRIDKSKTLRVENRIVKIIKIDTVHDLCAVEPIQEEGLKLGPRALEPLEEITLIGHPRGLPTVIRKGAIVENGLKACIFYYDGTKCLEATRISATAYAGNSGSPVLNKNGEVVAVLFAGQSAYPHEPLTVPFPYVKLFMNKLTAESIVNNIIK